MSRFILRTLTNHAMTDSWSTWLDLQAHKLITWMVFRLLVIHTLIRFTHKLMIQIVLTASRFGLAVRR